MHAVRKTSPPRTIAVVEKIFWNRSRLLGRSESVIELTEFGKPETVMGLSSPDKILNRRCEAFHIGNVIIDLGGNTNAQAILPGVQMNFYVLLEE